MTRYLLSDKQHKFLLACYNDPTFHKYVTNYLPWNGPEMWRTLSDFIIRNRMEYSKSEQFVFNKLRKYYIEWDGR